MRQRKELDRIVSSHRFCGSFKNGEIETYNVSPHYTNEFKGEGEAEVGLINNSILNIKKVFYFKGQVNLKEFRVGLKPIPPANRKQLVMMVAEYR